MCITDADVDALVSNEEFLLVRTAFSDRVVYCDCSIFGVVPPATVDLETSFV